MKGYTLAFTFFLEWDHVFFWDLDVLLSYCFSNIV